ncbi:hypothetical protein [Acidobacterium sp. S8]|uniref:hypothetical protein n=1 Tax=Acidobacterium sp. S8 TaxID=1641854 RepID=UPI00131E52CE|nr:hypothetical protein [Acidobacterium sp. S8]
MRRSSLSLLLCFLLSLSYCIQAPSAPEHVAIDAHAPGSYQDGLIATKKTANFQLPPHGLAVIEVK